MGVFVSISDHEGELLAKAIYLSSLYRQFPNLKDSHCLQFVREDEDTVFNTYQLSFLEKELQQIPAELKGDELDEYKHLTALIAKIKGKINTYLTFYGEKRID
jgi:hypothetical protein